MRSGETKVMSLAVLLSGFGFLTVLSGLPTWLPRHAALELDGQPRLHAPLDGQTDRLLLLFLLCGDSRGEREREKREVIIKALISKCQINQEIRNAEIFVFMISSQTL